MCTLSIKNNSCIDTDATVSLEDLLGNIISGKNQQYMEKLTDKVQQDPSKVLFVLGCGVSAPSGIPTWNRLIDKLWIKQLDRETKDFMPLWKDPEFIPPHTPDLLEYAEWTKLRCKESEKRPAPVDSVSSIPLDMSILRDVYDIFDKCCDVDKCNDVVNAIGNIMKHEQKINAVTYNYDCLIEHYFEVNDIEYLSIYGKKSMYDFWDTTKRKIYHVHGRVPVPEIKNFSRENMLDSKEKIVLTESDYYEMERYAYDWINAVQAERIHRKNMIIIGFSAQDFNFKRILRNIKKEDVPNQQKHVIFLPVEDILKDITYPDKTSSNIMRESTQKIAQHYMDIKSLYLEQYGIYPIWTCYEELPKLLNRLI